MCRDKFATTAYVCYIYHPLEGLRRWPFLFSLPNLAGHSAIQIVVKQTAHRNSPNEMPRRCALLAIAASLALASAFAPTDLDEAAAQLQQLASRLGQEVESPTIVLAGHHNDGKSALLQALLGLPLTHVGSSTSTRRVLRIETQFDPSRESPVLFLSEGAEERQLTAAELSTHIEAENSRLADRGQYEAKALRVRLAWRGAANLVLVDTPGLLSPPTGQALPDEALAKAAAEVEKLVLAELEPAGRLILCLEDTADWALPLTRAVVARADPQFRRCVLVATKLDSKLAQFAMADDLHRLLNPRAVAAAHPSLLAGPIFTAIPPIRGPKAGFSGVLAEQEASLCGLLAERLGTNVYSNRIGVESLRRVLAPHISSRWSQTLSSCSKSLEARIEHLQQELNSPPPPPAAESLDDFAERFARSVYSLIKGSVALPAGEYGETLKQEHGRSGTGALCDLEKTMASHNLDDVAAGGDADAESAGGGAAAAAASGAAGESTTHRELVEFSLHAEKRLYGGAQYWRVLQEFMLGAIEEPIEELSSEEVLNAMGFDGFHDGVNYMRAVCVIVVERARGYFEGSLERLRGRLLHVMGRLSALVDAQLRDEELREQQRGGGREAGGEGGCALSAAQHARYMAIATPLFERFVAEKMEACMSKCMHDVEAITKYVVWDQTSASKDSLYQVFIEPVAARMQERKERRGGGHKKGATTKGESAGFATYEELVASFTEVLTSRRVSEKMRLLMSDLVVEIVSAWRHEFVRMISLKLNSFFLMPFCESLPSYMRRALFKLEGEELLAEPTSDGAVRHTERLKAELGQLAGEKATLLQITANMRRQRGPLPPLSIRRGPKGKPQ